MPPDPTKPAPNRTQLSTAPTVLLTPASAPKRPLAPRSRIRRFLSADNLRDIGGTLAIVVPLTVLIWIWAEREQTVERMVRVTLEAVPATPAQSVRIVGIADDVVQLSLNGPTAGFDQFQRFLNDNKGKVEVVAPRLDVNEKVESSSRSIMELLGNAQALRDAGLTLNVEKSNPGSVTFEVDAVIAREVPVRLPPDLANGREAVIDPPTITVRGPRARLERLPDDVHFDLVFLNRQAILDLVPGGKVTLADVQVAPPEALRDLTVARKSVDSVVLSVVQTQERSVTISTLIPIYLELPMELQRARTQQGKQPIVASPIGLRDVQVVGPVDAIAALGRDDQRQPIRARILLRREDLDDLDNGVTLERQPELVFPVKGVTAVASTVPTVRVTAGVPGTGDAR